VEGNFFLACEGTDKSGICLVYGGLFESKGSLRNLILEISPASGRGMARLMIFRASTLQDFNNGRAVDSV
jgi:hypothetical protein